MSKSLGNAIFLCDTADQVAKKVMSMYTDPNHVRVSDPGKVDGNTVFMYLDIFDTDKKKVAELKDQYQKGGLGDVVLKKRLIEVLNNFLDPIRTARFQLEKDPEYVMELLIKGSAQTELVGQKTMNGVRKAMHLDY
jgi:tryptophanyl-tRNA synthetase